MKHNVGDLVANMIPYVNGANKDRRYRTELGYITAITSEFGDGYSVYFFYNNRLTWYSEEYVDALKKTFERNVENK